MASHLRLLPGALVVVAAACAPSMIVAPAAAAPNLNGVKATLSFTGTMNTRWSAADQLDYQDDCYIHSVDASGLQTVALSTRGRAVVTINDTAGVIAFQLPTEDRATSTKRATGWGLALVTRRGDYTRIQTNRGDRRDVCDPAPPNDVSDSSGCGTFHVPGMVEPYAARGRLIMSNSVFLPGSLAAGCPFFEVDGIGGQGSGAFPDVMSVKISAAKIRRALGRRDGRLTIRGRQRWTDRHPLGNLGGGISVTTTVRWSATFVRSRQSPVRR
jgi:hypothetical protein